MKILRQFVINGRRVTEYTRDGKSVSHIIEESSEKVDIPEPESTIGALQEENQRLKERIELAEAAIDDIIFGGGF